MMKWKWCKLCKLQTWHFADGICSRHTPDPMSGWRGPYSLLEKK